MAFESYGITLNGGLQRLSGLVYGATQAAAEQDVPCLAIILQPRGSNANAIYVGGSALTGATDCAFRLEAATGGVPPAPFVIELADRRLRLGDIYVIGTNTEGLNVGLVY